MTFQNNLNKSPSHNKKKHELKYIDKLQKVYFSF